MNDFRKKIPFFNKVILLPFMMIVISMVITALLSYYIMMSALDLYIDQESIAYLQKRFFISVSIVALMIMVVAFFILRKGLYRVLEPVGQLICGFNEVSKGNFHVQLEVTNRSEIGILCEQFNKMTLQISDLVEKIRTSRKADITSEQLMLNNLDAVFNEMEQIIDKSVAFRKLQRAEKMNAIGQLAASVAHEIRNPMTVVKGFLQIFLAKEHMSEEEIMYIHLMIEEMNRAEMIINDYLSLAKPDLEVTENVNGKKLVEKARELMSSYARMSKNIMIVAPVLENISVRGNTGELQQVLINILKNGIEALKDGGELRISLYKNGQYGVFEISDTGIGMTEEELQRLGTAFYSLKEKGTGVGLTICYQIINRMKGKIEVESQKGVGTTFKIYVPVYE